MMMAECAGTQEKDGDNYLRQKARDNLIKVFGELAGSEALTRALVAERTENREQAGMWLDVYVAVCNAEQANADPEVIRV
jgi:hypothetical protein